MSSSRIAARVGSPMSEATAARFGSAGAAEGAGLGMSVSLGMQEG
jgi:hypothetical protein